MIAAGQSDKAVPAELRAHLIESLRRREEGYVQNERLVPGQKARNVLSTLPRE